MRTLDGKLFRKMLANGNANLTNHFQEIDALNVFPVPDGDTGTNMSMTFNSGADSALNSGSEDITVLAKTLSKGLLMGARGNSGVITSQIFRGIYQGLADQEIIDVKVLADAFENGARVAYKAVMKPVEGTILTVIRETSWYLAKEVAENPDLDILSFFERLCLLANESLENTPELLPVLKEVGVVDSGGKGLVVIFEGFLAAVKGETIELIESGSTSESSQVNLESEEYGYCTEFIIQLNEDKVATFNENKLRQALSDLGNSLVCFEFRSKIW